MNNEIEQWMEVYATQSAAIEKLTQQRANLLSAHAVEVEALRRENADLKAKIADIAKGEDDGIR